MFWMTVISFLEATLLIEYLENWERAMPWLAREIWRGITVGNLVGGLLVLLVAGVLHVAIWWFFRRRPERSEENAAREPAHEREARKWFKLLLGAAISPLAVLVWVYGIYASLFWVLLPFRVDENAALPAVLVFLDWVRDVAVFAILAWLVFRLIGVVDVRLRDRAAKSDNPWDDILAPLVGRTLRLVLPLIVLILALPMVGISPDAGGAVRTVLSVLIIVFMTAVLFQAVRAVEEGVLRQFRIDVQDNLRARKLHTQVTVLKKLSYIVIGIFALASTLMVFESLRQLGTSILASAGIAGIIIGFAAQRSLGTLLAGFQIAITQPIRLDDVVIVENEWGRIEEITLTYVVVRIWDLRRLVLPIDYFITKPFQNWTRQSAEILGTVFIYVDYTVPVEALRAELDRILEASKLWDRKVKVLQVTDLKERTVEIRALMSAPDAGTAFDLRCEVREKLVRFVRDNYPEALPRFRAEIWERGSGEMAKVE